MKIIFIKSQLIRNIMAIYILMFNNNKTTLYNILYKKINSKCYHFNNKNKLLNNLIMIIIIYLILYYNFKCNYNIYCCSFYNKIIYIIYNFYYNK